MRVLVGLSGGVDSSVTALILKQKGYEVIGTTMSIWGKNGLAASEGKHNACYGPDEIEDIETAKELAKQLDIPYHVVDCVTKYEDIVISNFKKESLAQTIVPLVWQIQKGELIFFKLFFKTEFSPSTKFIMAEWNLVFLVKNKYKVIINSNINTTINNNVISIEKFAHIPINITLITIIYNGQFI